MIVDMSRTLCIPDIHNRWVQAQHLIDTVPHDKCILLGDYFDNFNDTPDHAHNTAVWLKELVLTNPKIVPLIGNHDQYYFWPWYSYFRGSGYSEAKSHAIRKVLNQDDVAKFKFFTVEQGYALSHAGLTCHLWKEFLRNEDDDAVTTLDFFYKVLTERVNRNLNMIGMNRPAELFMAGWDRGGDCRYGGMTWCDWRSFAPIKGINQIFGHSPHNLPEVLIQKKKGDIKRYVSNDFYNSKINLKNVTSINFALDTHSKHYAIIEDGVLSIYDSITKEDIKNVPAADETVLIESLKEQMRKEALAAGSTVTVPNKNDWNKIIDGLKNGKAKWTQVKDDELTD